MRTRSRAVRLLPVVLVLALPVAPAAAERASVRDPSGDMIRVEEGGSDPQAAPTARVGDVVRTTFRHDVRRVVVRTRFAALARTGRRFTTWVDVRDRPGHTWTIGVQATRRDRRGQVILMDEHGRDLPCTAVHRIRYGIDTVRIAVPRRCFGDPDRLRFRLITEQVRQDWTHAWLDNGLATTMDDRRWTAWLTPG